MKMHHPFPNRADPRRKSGFLEKIWHGSLVPWFYCRIRRIHSYHPDGIVKFLHFPDEPAVGTCLSRSACCGKRGLVHVKNDSGASYPISYPTCRDLPHLR